MKTPKPWYRTDRDAWYVCLHGRQHFLARGKHNKRLALKTCHRRLADDPGRLTDQRRPLTVVRLAKLYLRWLKKNRAPATVTIYRYFLRSFCRGKRRLLVDRLSPHHVDV